MGLFRRKKMRRLVRVERRHDNPFRPVNDPCIKTVL